MVCELLFYFSSAALAAGKPAPLNGQTPQPSIGSSHPRSNRGDAPTAHPPPVPVRQLVFYDIFFFFEVGSLINIE